MNIFKRLKNLWELSEFKITAIKQINNGSLFFEKEKLDKNKMATIVDLSPDVELD